jgi:outer membrane lipase/esterase
MKSKPVKGALAALLFWATSAFALPYSNLVVFGDSLADSGNNALIADAYYGGARSDAQAVGAAVPDLPYGSNRYSNGPVWTEYFANSLGMSLSPSLLGGNNYAYGGARVTGSSPVPTLQQQMGQYLSANTVSASALYVIEGGGNDARDVLELYVNGGDYATRIQGYVQGLVGMVGGLAARGAEHFLVWNVTDLGRVPAVTAQGVGAAQGASAIVAAMNQALAMAFAAYLPPSVTDGLVLFDAYAGLNDIVSNPAAFGLANAADACAATPTCDPDTYFFWDGIHPTTAGHQVMARLAVAAIPEPGSLALLAVALLGLAVGRQRRA